MSEHTPGPWGWLPADSIANGRSILVGWCGAKGQFHEGLGHTLTECGAAILACEGPYEDCPDVRDQTPNEPDALLIAAAPELLEAAKRASVTLDSAEHSLQVMADTGEKESGHTHACRARANMARETKAEIDAILTRLQGRKGGAA